MCPCRLWGDETIGGLWDRQASVLNQPSSPSPPARWVVHGRDTHSRECQPPSASPVAVQLHVSGHLAMGHCVRQLLQLQGLEVHTLTLVWHDEVRVQWALRASCLIPARGQEKGSQEPREPIPGVSNKTNSRFRVLPKLGKGPKTRWLCWARTPVRSGETCSRPDSSK